MAAAVKTYADSYLYGKANYEKNWMEFFIKSNIIEKSGQLYDDIEYVLKRTPNSDVLLKTLRSSNVIMLCGNAPLPRAFKVFSAKDIKSGDKKTKVFIDMTDILTNNKEGGYTFNAKNSDILISYVIAALANLIYYAAPDKIVNNTTLLDAGSEMFSKMFTHIIDYLRLGGVDKVREKSLYLSSLYYQMSVLKLPFSPSIERRAVSNSKLDVRTSELISSQMADNTFDNIDTFIKSTSTVLRADGLTLDVFVERWLFMYGNGTQFSLELFPAFSTMITNAYGGAYLNNQKLIEKLVGAELVKYTTTLLRIGSDLR